LPLTVILALLAAQPAPPPPTWKEFSIGPARRRLATDTYLIRQGMLRSGSIPIKLLVALATDTPRTRVLGPEWMATERVSITATLADESRLRLHTRSPDDPTTLAQFRTLLTQELVRRLHLEYHREACNQIAYTLRAVEAGPVNMLPARSDEHSGLRVTGTFMTNVTSTLDARGASLLALGRWLQNRVNAPVTLDASLPVGTYDFSLKWQTGNQASLLTALRDQLGLELVETTRSQECLIVDRIDQPPFAAR